MSFLRSFHGAPRVRARFLTFIFCAALFGCISLPVAAQEQKPEEDEVLRVSTDLLLFTARARDKNGKRPDGLKEQDLSLKDPDGVVSSLYFSPGVDRVAIVFALDESGSLRDVISRQRDAAIGLYQRFNTLSSMAVLHFSARPTVVAPFTREAKDLDSAFAVRARENQRTAIFDAGAQAEAMFDTLPRVRSERRIVVLISDGLDNASATKADAVIESAKRNRVSFYVIHLPLFEPRDGRLAVRRPSAGFRDLAEKTGGKYFLANDSALTPKTAMDLSPIFKAIEEDLKSQYLIGFYLNEKANDGARHNFSLSVPPGIEYQIFPRGYDRTQKFVVHRPRESLRRR